ncbi:MAG: lipase family protein [Arenicellales bacterium]
MDDSIDFRLDSDGRAHLEPSLTDLVGAASLEAYTDYENSSNPSYTPPNLNYGSRPYVFRKRFTGFDDVDWGSGIEERFGLIYQWSARPDYYLIAFRGTSSIYDMVLDLESPVPVEFEPYRSHGNFPHPVHVGDGFYKIYSTRTSPMKLSMRAQLFQDIASFSTPPSHIIITGHSLGCALASLFALDLAASGPSVSILNVNFASPRVGTGSWENAYNNTYALEKKTVRVRNAYDMVPKLPPEYPPIDFRHVGMEFPVSFTVEDYSIDLKLIIESWHSLLNYRYVVDRAVKQSPQVWTGKFPDQAYKKWNMISHDPYTSATELEGADARRELELLRQLKEKGKGPD